MFVELKSGIAFGLTMPDPPYYGNWEEVTADNYRRHIFKQPWNLLDGHNDVPVTEEPLAAQTDSYFAARSSRADIPKALEILHRAGSDNPPIPSDELPS